MHYTAKQIPTACHPLVETLCGDSREPCCGPHIASSEADSSFGMIILHLSSAARLISNVLACALNRASEVIIGWLYSVFLLHA